MAIALVTTAAASTGTTVPFSASVTTSGANNFIVAWVVLNGPSGTIRPTAPSISDSNNLVWFLRKNSVPDDFAVPDMYMYYAWAPTGVTTTISVSALNPVSMSLTVAVFSGVNTTSPFDPNLSMPSQTNGTDLVFNTTLPNTTLIGAFSVSSPTPIASYGVPAGWTAVSTDGNYCFAAFKSVTSAQTMSTTGFAGATANNSGIGDALQPASVVGYNYGNLTENLSAIGIAASGAPAAGNPSAFQWSNYGYPGPTAASGTFVGQDNAAGPNGYVAAGDLLVAVITLCTQSTSPPAVPTMPAPWVLRAINTATPTNGTSMAIFTKTGSAGEDVNYTCLWAGGTAAYATWSLYNYGACVFDYAAIATGVNTSSAPIPTVFTSSNNDLQLAVFYNGGAYGLVDAPGGFELPRVNTTYGGSLGYLAAYEGPSIANANATVTGPPAYTNPDVPVDQVAALIALETEPPGSSAVIHGSMLESTLPVIETMSGTVTGTGFPSSFAWANHGDGNGLAGNSAVMSGPANSSVAVGDLLVAFVWGVFGTAATQTVTLPGWTLVSSIDDIANGDNVHYKIFYKQVTAAQTNFSATATIAYDGYTVWSLFNYTNSTFESAVASVNNTTSQNYIQAPAPSPQPAYNGDVILNMWWAWQPNAPSLVSGQSPPSPAVRIAFGTKDGSSSMAATEFMVINKNSGIGAITVNAASSGLTYPYGATVVITPASAISGVTTDTGNLSAALGAASAIGAGNVFGAGGATLAQTTAPATLSAAGAVSGVGSHPGGYVWSVYTQHNGWGDDNAATPVATEAFIGGTTWGSNIAVNDTNTPMFTGDLIVIGIMTTTYTATDSGAISMPGWTAGPQVTTNGARLGIFWANAGGGGWSGIPSGFAVTWVNPAYYSYAMFNYGAASVDVVGALAQTPAQNSNGATVTTPPITTTKDFDILLALFFKYAALNPADMPFTGFPSGFTTRVNVNSADYLPVGAAEQQLALAGSVPAYSATAAADGCNSLAASIAIKPNLIIDTGHTSATLGAVTLSGAGFIASNLSTGTLAQTTHAATLSASGTVVSPITGAVTFNAGVSGASGTDTCTLPVLTTTVANTVIVLFIEENNTTLSSFDLTSPTITDTAGLTWVKRKAQPSSQVPFGIYEYYAVMPTAGATTITITHTGVNFFSCAAGAFAGVNLTSPYDTNASLPNGGPSNNGATGATPISTTAQATAILYSNRVGINDPSPYAPPTGYTNFDATPSNTPFLQTYYGIFAAPQTNANPYNPHLAGVGGNGWILDALQAANVSSITGNLSTTLGADTLSASGITHAVGSISVDTYNTTSASTNTCTLALTTHTDNEIIVLWVEGNSNIIAQPTITDTAGLTWTLRKNQTSSTSAAFSLCEFWALMPSAGSTNITANLTNGFFIAMSAASFIGVNTTNPFDINSSLPAGRSTVSTSSPITYSTSNPMAMVITGIRTADGANPIGSGLVPSGFTPISIDGGWIFAGFKNVSTTQTNATMVYPGTSDGGIVDVLLPAGSNPTNSGTVVQTLGTDTLSAVGFTSAVNNLTATWVFSPKADTLFANGAGVDITITGAVSRMLSAATLTAEGSATTNTGALAKTLAGATLSSSGTVSSLLGALAQTLGAATLSSAGSVTVNSGTLSQTTGFASLVSSGLVLSVIPGTVEEGLGTATMVAAGNLTTPVLIGHLTQTLGAVTDSLAGTVYPVLIGTLLETTGAATLGAAGEGSFPTLTGTLGQTLEAAFEPTPATGLVQIDGDVAVTLRATTLSAEGNLTDAATGGVGETLSGASLLAAGNVLALQLGLQARGNTVTYSRRSIPRYTSSLRVRAQSTTTSQAALMQHIAIAARGAAISTGHGTLAPVTSTRIFLHTQGGTKTSGRSIFLTTPPPAVVDTENTFAPFTATIKLFATQITSDSSGETLVIERAPTKAPNEARSVAFDFTSELATGETIASASVNIFYNTPTEAAPAVPANQPGDLTNGAVGINGNQVTTALALGVYGKDYLVTFTAVTSAGEIIPRSILLTVGQT